MHSNVDPDIEDEYVNGTGFVVLVPDGPLSIDVTGVGPAAVLLTASPTLGAISTRYTVGVSDSTNFLTPIRMDKYGAWVQDDWKATSRLTLNLGARYDLIWNAFAQNVDFPPFELPGRRPLEWW